jgi:hypothetical protein
MPTLDHVDPRIFWPSLVLVWFLASLAVGLLVGRVIRWCDSPGRRIGTDAVAESQRRIARNGFKSRMGVR